MTKKTSIVVVSILTLVLTTVFFVPGKPIDGVRDFIAGIAGQRPGVFAITTLTTQCVQGVPRVTATWSTSQNAVTYHLERKYPWASSWEVTGETKSLTLDDATWSLGYGVGLYSYRVRAFSSLSSRLSPSLNINITSCASGVDVSSSGTSTPTTPITGTTTPLISAPVSISALQVIPGNLIQNSSLEVDLNNDGVPDKWVKGGWGTNNRTYAYPVSGVDGARAVGVTVSGYVNGDAKWVFDNVPVTAGQTYQFSDHYYSTQLTQILVTYVGVNSTPTYVLLAKLPSSVGTWQTYSGTFTVPTGVTFLTVTHVLNGNGTLSIDGVALVPDVATQTPVATQVPTPTPSPTTAVSTTTVSSVGNTVAIGKIPSWVKWGAYVGWQDTAMSEFETLVGKQPSMEMVFAHWGNDQFPSWYAPRIKEKGRTMVLFWEAIDYNRNYFTQPEYSFDSVLAGKQDAYFTKFALDAKNYGGEVVIIPYSEFNGDWFPWGGVVGNNTPEKYIAAYRYVHNFFINVPNVKFGWAVNADSVPDTAANQMELFYPGDAYVDIVGVDGFNSGVPTWMTFAQVFDNPLSRLKVYKKPIYIFSMGAAEDVRKPAWIIDGLGAQLALHPEVSGVLWFNENKQYNWLVNSSSAALSAFKAVLP